MNSPSPVRSKETEVFPTVPVSSTLHILVIRWVTLPGTSTLLAPDCSALPASLPQINEELSAVKLFGLLALSVKIPPLPMVTIDPGLELLD